MSFFSSSKRTFLDSHESAEIIAAIKQAERKTSGEIRVYIESKCRYVSAIDRASEIFDALKMERTDNHNAVLIYLAVKDRQVAIFGDHGIHKKTGDEFWEKEVAHMLEHFRKEHYATGICKAINDVGEALHYHFPYDNETDKNELPDDIVFGK